jgi:hypothetical protein
VILPSSIGRILHFGSLDVYHDLRHVFAVGWRFTDTPDDAWTSRMNAFKRGSAEAIPGAAAVMSEAIQIIKWGERNLCLATALGSRDSELNLNAPLTRMSVFVAEKTGIPYQYGFLKKRPHRSLHQLSSSEERHNEVQNAYDCQVRGNRQTTYIVLDDFVTRGDTLSEIGRAIRESQPNASVVGFVLGKTERQSYAASCGHSLNNEHIPEEWAELWDRSSA